jgi:hypothetical protein
MIPVAERAFHQRLGQLLSLANGNGYWPALGALLADYVGFDWMFAINFQVGLCPQVLYENASNALGGVLFNEYIRRPYILDPFYLFSMGSFIPGLYRLDQVAAERFWETEYYHRYFSHSSVVDEVQFLTKSPRGGVLSLSLGSKQRFTDDQISLLYLYEPWILPLLHIPVLLCGSDPKAGPVPAADIEARIRQRAPPESDCLAAIQPKVSSRNCVSHRRP